MAEVILDGWGREKLADEREDSVRTSLEEIGHALSSGDAAAVARFWDLPALVLADQGARAVESHQEVEAFFEASIASYRERGTPTAKPDVTGVKWISDRVAAVSVEWIGVDSGGVERLREMSFYLMRMGDDGIARIHVAMAMTDSAPE